MPFPLSLFVRGCAIFLNGTTIGYGTYFIKSNTMKRSDIPTHAVLLASWLQRKSSRRIIDILVDYFQCPYKVAIRAIEREERRGYLDWGVAVTSAHLTPAGEAKLREFANDTGTKPT